VIKVVSTESVKGAPGIILEVIIVGIYSNRDWASCRCFNEFSLVVGRNLVDGGYSNLA
jgi:hypothetical protein